jgi:glycogen synthase kinase 3 beta
MNPSYSEFKFPAIRQQNWNKVFRSKTEKSAVDLIAHLLVYDPVKRLHPIEAIIHPFFDELRDEATRLPNGNELPDLFDFSKEEIM